MKTNYGELLLEDAEVQELLKQLILEKANYYDEISKKILSEEEIDALLSSEITQETIFKILDHDIAKDEGVILKRDLSAMCYLLNKSRNKVRDNMKWEQAYEYATHIVRIADVVANLIGVSNVNRNINCPFHTDKSPSLKIYTKNNRFVCFSCGARGSPIDFVMKYKNCSFQEAVLYLSNL